jgi:hypothetical protein
MAASRSASQPKEFLTVAVRDVSLNHGRDIFELYLNSPALATLLGAG